MRIGVEPALGRWDPHQFQQLQCPLSRRRPIAAGMAAHRLADLPPDRIDRIERRHRLLEDHRHQAAAQIAQRSRPHRQDIVSVDTNGPLDAGAPRRQQAHQRPQRDTFAGTRLAQNAQDLARLHREADPVHRVDGGLAGNKAHV